MTRFIEFTGGDVEAYLQAQENKDLLRFITCGSVDDGKSTLIGRLLYEAKMLFEDQLSALEADSKKMGTQGGNLDFALLVDGLAAEREQGITIDVAYRAFTTDKRKFIVADTPGHEQYTRNMATGASTADLAIILIDARKGVLTQTRRHTFICTLLGIRHLVVAVNKMDLMDYRKDVFDKIEQDYRAFAKSVGASDITMIPLSALAGDNVIARSPNMPWYHGSTLMAHLETVPVGDDLDSQPFRLPVQWVNRPDQNFRGFSGSIVSGSVAPGDAIKVLPSGKTSTIERVVTYGGDLAKGVAGQSLTVTFRDEIDVSRGDVICAANAPVEVSDQFQVDILWMDEEAMLPGRSYVIKAGTRQVPGTIETIRHKVNVNTMEHVAAKSLALNEIAVCNLELDTPIAFAPYKENRHLGSFIVIDRFSNNTVGMGLIRFALRRAANIHWQALDVNKVSRAGLAGQKPAVLWFTGLSGAGKSTIANLVEKKLHAEGRMTYLLDGDNVRHGLNRDLGFTDADRVENIRRVAEVSKLMVDAGLIVLVSFISPFRSERLMARELVEDGEFVEIFVDTPLAEA
ncbi:MAG: sulfate adenylyltransferase subunit CysN, partial [Aestuariivirga sp.]